MKEQEPPPQNPNRQDSTIDWVENRYGNFPGDTERYHRPVKNNPRVTSRKNPRVGTPQAGNGQQSDRGGDKQQSGAFGATLNNTSNHFRLQWLFVGLAVFLVVVFACVGFFLLRDGQTTSPAPSDQSTATSETVPSITSEGATSPDNSESTFTGPETKNPKPEENDESDRNPDAEKVAEGSEGKIVENNSSTNRKNKVTINKTVNATNRVVEASVVSKGSR